MQRFGMFGVKLQRAHIMLLGFCEISGLMEFAPSATSRSVSEPVDDGAARRRRRFVDCSWSPGVGSNLRFSAANRRHLDDSPAREKQSPRAQGSPTSLCGPNASGRLDRLQAALDDRRRAPPARRGT